MPEIADLNAPMTAGRATAHRKLAADKPACLAMGTSLDMVCPVPFVIVVRTSIISVNGARCIMVAMSMEYVTFRTSLMLIYAGCGQKQENICVCL